MIRRTALATVALGSAALLLTACGSSHSAASGPANGAKASTTGSAAPSNPASPATPASPPSSPAGAGNAPAPNAAAPTTAPAPAPTTAPAVAPAAPAAATRTAKPIHTQTLVDGSKAEIYKLGDEHYLAKVVHNGELFVTLETHGHDAGLDANDMFIELSLDGTLHSWMGGGKQGPGTFKLAGGWTAKVTKIGELRYRAQILGNEGEVDATVETNQHDVGLDANGIYIVLSDGGIISAHA